MVIAGPAMIMALGSSIRFTIPYLFLQILPASTVTTIQLILAILLGVWFIYLIYLILSQACKDYHVVWDYTIKHFATATWVISVNFYGILLSTFPIFRWVSISLAIIGCTLWLMHMYWFARTMTQPIDFKKFNGITFLTTVTCQSVVVGLSNLFPNAGPSLYIALSIICILGVIIYCGIFYIVWIFIGIRKHYKKWSPTNNITHGGISLSIVAAELIYANQYDNPTLLMIINIVWIFDSIVVLLLFLVELKIIIAQPDIILLFQIPNYARNFTYNMYWACTFLGWKLLPGSIMQKVLGIYSLSALAFPGIFVNLWELSHQIYVTIPFILPTSEQTSESRRDIIVHTSKHVESSSIYTL